MGNAARAAEAAADAAYCAAKVAKAARLGAATASEFDAFVRIACRVVNAVDDRELVAAAHEDYRSLQQLATERGWTDDTPVPQIVFGPGDEDAGHGQAG